MAVENNVNLYNSPLIGRDPVTSSEDTGSPEIVNRINDCTRSAAFINPLLVIEENIPNQIFHLKAPNQLDVFKNSSFAKATLENDYCAQYTTCGWVAAYLTDNLCRILSRECTVPKEVIQSLLENSGPDEFIRKSTDFIGDLTAYGGSDDKVEGLLLGEDIYAILQGTQPEGLANVFVVEGATEEADLKNNDFQFQIFNSEKFFAANYKSSSEFSSLREAIMDVVVGKRSFVVIVSLETVPVGRHYVSYVLRKNSDNLLECLLFEGLNEPHNDWVSFDTENSSTAERRSTTEWIYNELILKGIPDLFSRTVDTRGRNSLHP